LQIRLHVRPLTLAQANELVTNLHRHHRAVQGHRFSIGCYDDDGICHGAAIVGRPVARKTDQYEVAEVTRLVTDGMPNACSVLYAAAARAAQAMGYVSIQTFILADEPGTSLKAAGWHLDGVSPGGSWSQPSRLRTDKAPTVAKQRWVRRLNNQPAAKADVGLAA
jgi:hypothetical protein